MSNTMNYRGYTASMAFDTDDKIIVGRVVDIDDIITFHGDYVGEFEVAFHAVIDDYIVGPAKFIDCQHDCSALADTGRAGAPVRVLGRQTSANAADCEAHACKIQSAKKTRDTQTHDGP